MMTCRGRRLDHWRIDQCRHNMFEGFRGMRMLGRLIVALCAIIVSAIALPSSAAAQPIPNPEIRLIGTEAYSTASGKFIRYRLDVSNKASFPEDLFIASPGLPPCGKNANASRSWVDVFDAKGTRLYGFCALGSPADLGAVWFAVPEGAPPPSSAYIEIWDRLTNRRYRSNPVVLAPAKTESSSAGATTQQKWVVLRKDADLIFAADVASRSPSGTYPMAVFFTPRGSLDTTPDRPTIIAVNGKPDCSSGTIKYSGESPYVDQLNEPGLQEKLQYSSAGWRPMICGGKEPSYRPFANPATLWSVYGLFDNSGGSDLSMGFLSMGPGRLSFFRSPLPFTATHILFYSDLPSGGHLEADRQIDCASRRVSTPSFELVGANLSRKAMSRPEWIADAAKDDEALLRWQCDKLSAISVAADFSYVEAAFRRHLVKP